MQKTEFTSDISVSSGAITLTPLEQLRLKSPPNGLRHSAVKVFHLTIKLIRPDTGLSGEKYQP